MKCKFIILILFFTNLNILAQNKSNKIYLEYRVMRNRIPSTEYLISNGKNSLYTTKFINFDNKKNNFKKDEENTIKIEQNKIKINKLKYFTTQNSNILYFSSIFPNGKKIIAVDSLPEYTWKINKKETKQINNLTCYKATTIFRGSNITAYYTSEIPIDAGPFKFKGLPGLILEIYNTDTKGSKYSWKLKNFIYPFNEKVNLVFNEENYKENLVTYRSIVEQFDKKMDNFNKKSLSNMPRGSRLILEKSERSGIEKIYEWEEETTQN